VSDRYQKGNPGIILRCDIRHTTKGIQIFTMTIIEPIIRPPSEAYSFLLQITVGCSSNTCSFCGAYYNKLFRIKDINEIFVDIEKGASLYPEKRKVFLLDGDALQCETDKLLAILDKINFEFPRLTRVSSYANGYNISVKDNKELKELAQNKLKFIYMGLESGSQKVLDLCKKKSGVEEMIESVKRSAQVGIKSSVIVLLGLGGKRFSDIHVKETIKALNKMQPRYLSFLTLMLIPGTELFEQAEKGEFESLTPKEILSESYRIIKGLDLKGTIFRSDHASNYLTLEGRFPQGKPKFLKTIEKAMNGKLKLNPESLRGL